MGLGPIKEAVLLWTSLVGLSYEPISVLDRDLSRKVKIWDLDSTSSLSDLLVVCYHLLCGVSQGRCLSVCLLFFVCPTPILGSLSIHLNLPTLSTLVFWHLWFSVFYLILPLDGSTLNFSLLLSCHVSGGVSLLHCLKAISTKILSPNCKGPTKKKKEKKTLFFRLSSAQPGKKRKKRKKRKERKFVVIKK